MTLNTKTHVAGLCTRIAFGAVLTAAFFCLEMPARANTAQQLVTNGGFETTTSAGNGGPVNGGGQMGYNINATGWSTSGYNFIFASGTGDSPGTTGADGALSIWGPNSGSGGSANGLPASSPDGGNYVAADGAYEVGAIMQTLTSLTPGTTYAVSFYYAGAQQYTFSGTTSEAWKVSLGGSATQETTVLADTNHGFTGWQYETMLFTADATSDVLSFLAVGTPSGEPPFSLLDGVSVTQYTATPEPESVVLTLGALATMAGLFRFRKRSGKTASSDRQLK